MSSHIIEISISSISSSAWAGFFNYMSWHIIKISISSISSSGWAGFFNYMSSHIIEISSINYISFIYNCCYIFSSRSASSSSFFDNFIIFIFFFNWHWFTFNSKVIQIFNFSSCFFKTSHTEFIYRFYF